MNQSLLTIEENIRLTDTVYQMKLKGDVSGITCPGQFVNLKLDGFFLRRPLSVCNCESGVLTLLYKVVGHGTRQMAGMTAGDKVDALCGLGNGFDLTRSGDKPLLIGGGVGVPPLYWTAKKLLAEGKRVSVVMGFNKAEEVFYEEEFRALGCDVTVTTVDGRWGCQGFVTDQMPKDYSYFYTCGPEPMLRAVYRTAATSGQLSFEERMGCGFGACMGCSCKTVTGYKRICREGPVLEKEEILWDA